MNDVDNLDDNCFVLASHAFIEISEAMQQEMGRKPTLEEFCNVLAWGFQGAGDDLVSDASPARIEQVVCRLRKAKVERLSPGDIIAIPRNEKKYYVGIYIVKNRFGHAFGFFRGLRPCRPLSTNANFEPCGVPIYTTLHSLWDGRWRLIGHRPDLLVHFDKDPEIYHAKDLNLEDEAIGPFGAAERASGELRSIDAVEAARVGLLAGTYRQTVLAKDMASTLDARDCGKKK